MRRLLPSLLVLLACSSEVDVETTNVDEPMTDSVARSDAKKLEGCYTEPCGSWKPVYDPDKPAVSCIIDAAVTEQRAHVTIYDVADGGLKCHAETRVFVVGDGTAYLWFARDSVCDDAAVFDAYQLERCQVDQDAVVACQAEVAAWEPSGADDTPACASPSEWLLDCQEATLPPCS
jgi:hypothetical protein